MPSFDVVSEVDTHEISNAVDQANREVQTRFDFKGVDAKFELSNDTVTLQAEVIFQLEQMLDILYKKMVKRNVDTRYLEEQYPVESGRQAKQELKIKKGIEQATAKQIIRDIKQMKVKVSASIMEDKLRVTGKKLDDLQSVIASLKANDYKLPLQYLNFRS